MFNQYVMNKYMFRVLWVIDSLIFQLQCQMCKILQDNNVGWVVQSWVKITQG